MSKCSAAPLPCNHACALAPGCVRVRAQCEAIHAHVIGQKLTPSCRGVAQGRGACTLNVSRRTPRLGALLALSSSLGSAGRTHEVQSWQASLAGRRKPQQRASQLLAAKHGHSRITKQASESRAPLQRHFRPRHTHLVAQQPRIHERVQLAPPQTQPQRNAAALPCERTCQSIASPPTRVLRCESSEPARTRGVDGRSAQIPIRVQRPIRWTQSQSHRRGNPR